MARQLRFFTDEVEKAGVLVAPRLASEQVRGITYLHASSVCSKVLEGGRCISGILRLASANGLQHSWRFGVALQGGKGAGRRPAPAATGACSVTHAPCVPHRAVHGALRCAC